MTQQSGRIANEYGVSGTVRQICDDSRKSVSYGVSEPSRTRDRGALRVEQLDNLRLHWSGGGAAHREGCRHLNGRVVSGDVAAAALAYRQLCGTCFRGGERSRIERRMADALIVAISTCLRGALRLPEGWHWQQVHQEAQAVRQRASEAVERVDLGDGSECQCGLDTIGECQCPRDVEDGGLPW